MLVPSTHGYNAPLWIGEVCFLIHSIDGHSTRPYTYQNFRMHTTKDGKKGRSYKIWYDRGSVPYVKSSWGNKSAIYRLDTFGKLVVEGDKSPRLNLRLERILREAFWKITP